MANLISKLVLGASPTKPCNGGDTQFLLGVKTYTDASSAQLQIPITAHLCAITGIGQVREKNEDAIHLVPEVPALIVADGMGGHPAGEFASALAVETVANRLRQAIAHGKTLDHAEVESLLRLLFDDAQEAVIADADTNPQRRRLTWFWAGSGSTSGTCPGSTAASAPMAAGCGTISTNLDGMMSDYHEISCDRTTIHRK